MEKNNKILWIVSFLGALMLFPNSRILPFNNAISEALNVLLMTIVIFIAINIPLFLVKNIVGLLIRLELTSKDIYNFFRYAYPLRRLKKKSNR